MAKRPFVFVVMSFAPEFGDVYELGIKPACEAIGAECARVDEQIFLESILDRIYGQIEEADIVVSEMSGRNPNVFYETGYAHGLRKPVVLLTRSADDIPFDLRHYPHVVYDRIATLKAELQKRLAVVAVNPQQAVAKMLRASQAAPDMGRMAKHIENYLDANEFDAMSFDRVRQNINASYSDELLRRLIDERPEQFRRTNMKGDKPGIARAAAKTS